MEPYQIIEIINNDSYPEKTLSYSLLQLISEQCNYPPKIVKKGINENHLFINGKSIKDYNYKIKNKDEIYFQGKLIQFPKEKEDTKFDKFIALILQECLRFEDFNNLFLNQKYLIASLVLEYFIKNEYNSHELIRSKHNDDIFIILKEIYKSTFTIHPGKHIPKNKDLVNELISARETLLDKFREVIQKIKKDIYDYNSGDIFKDFHFICNSKIFSVFIKPLISGKIGIADYYDKIIREYKKILDSKSKREGYILKVKIFEKFDSLKIDIDNLKFKEISTILNELLEILITKVNEKSGLDSSGVPSLKVEPELRVYNLAQKEINIYLKVTNDGSGIAQNVKILRSTGTDYLIDEQTIIDILGPSEKRKSKFNMKFNTKGFSIEKKKNLQFRISYIDEFNEIYNREIKEFLIEEQDIDLPWEELNLSKPYSLLAISNPNKLFGRTKLIENIRWSIEKSERIPSIIIFGQKRVGKSSIVKTLKTIYENHPDILFIYKSIGDVKNADAHVTFKSIGESIYKSLLLEFKRKYPESENYLNNEEKPSFYGSLSPLNNVLDDLKSINNQVRVIIVLDEFDELNKEFFENGEIGKTFALNIGKGINEKDFVGFILVGSENMIHKAQTGMRLNTYEVKKVDTFNKKNEFDSYIQLIVEPTKSCLHFEPEVFDFLHDETSGNPYFTNLILQEIFKDAYEKRFSHIGIDYVENHITYFIDNIVTNNEFAHFIQDGLYEDSLKYELVLDRRRRLLTAFSIVKRKVPKPKWSDLKRNIKYPKKFKIPEEKMEDTLNEFKRREIIIEQQDGVLKIEPNIFERWLMGPGLYQIISDIEEKDEIIDEVISNQELSISDDVLEALTSHLCENVSKKMVSTIKDFIFQFEDYDAKRRIINLLRKTLIISSNEAISHLKKTKSQIWEEVFLKEGEKNIRKDVEIISLEGSFEQNQDFFKIIKEVFNLSANKKLKKPAELNTIEKQTKNLIIYEPLIDCQYYFRNEFAKLLKKINPVRSIDLNIFVLCFLISDEAKTAIEDLFSNHFFYSYRILELKTLPRNEMSPFYSSDSINDLTWNLVASIYRKTSNKSTLVKIGDIFPYQNLPFIWSKDIGNFDPLISNPTNLFNYEKKNYLSHKLENEWNFTSETPNIEFKASLSEPGHNWKELNKKVKKIKAVPEEHGNQILFDEIEKEWNLNFQRTNKETISNILKHSIMKTIAAFANTNGGKLFVGVDDDLTIGGLIYDKKILKTEEEYRRFIDHLIENYIGIEFSDIVHLKFHDLFDGNQLLEISVDKSITEIGLRRNDLGQLLSRGKEDFYIRRQQRTDKLGSIEFAEWRIRRRNIMNV